MHDTTTRIPLAAGSSKRQPAAQIAAFLQEPQHASLLAREEIAPLLAADLAKIEAGEAQRLAAGTTNALARRIRGIEREMQLKQRTSDMGLLEGKHALLRAIETACRESRLAPASPQQGKMQR
jgi:hypothetical protein